MTKRERAIWALAGVTATALFIIAVLFIFASEQPKIAVEPTVISAQLHTIEAQDYRVQIQSFGRVQPHVNSRLVAQVSGRIVKISPNFRPGGHFHAGEKLLWIEDDDYRHSVTVARSQLVRARSELIQEQAMHAQAQRDWQRLGGAQMASALTLREPQIERARSESTAMEARLAMAELNLKRTVISAPFSGRLRVQMADVGQVVAPGTVLAEIYDDDKLEVRLPILFRDMPFVPVAADAAQPKGASEATEQTEPSRVSLSPAGRPDIQWSGRIVRAEAGIEQSSYQQYLVARIVPSDSLDPPIVGQYVDSIIDGTVVRGAVVIPAGALYKDSYVWLVNTDDRLEKRSVQVLWRNDSSVVVKSGLRAGETIALTRLSHLLEGTPVRDADSP
ncbi:MAG: efflux RND transporter periplasmic adaptor subunit [Proteobacteria bacterium]|nr:efflux RND transporter periplasmic adaptor subunit [Pseudomonadota bacterium]